MKLTTLSATALAVAVALGSVRVSADEAVSDDTLPSAQQNETLRKASVDGTYQHLLLKFKVEADKEKYGKFNDFGHSSGGTHGGVTDVPSGYWVYVYPHWYIWRDKVDRAKDFTLPSARDNSLVRLSDHSGKVVLINWWRSSCGYCHREMPALLQLYNKYRDQGLVVLGVSCDTADSVAGVPEFLKRYGVTWPVALNDQGEFMREIRPKGVGETPCNYLVSRTGELRFLGAIENPEEDWKKIEEAVVGALAEPVPKEPAIAPRALADAPAFALPDLSGKTVRLADFRGKPLLVHMFNHATCDWTGSLIARLHKEYAPRGFQVVGINLFDNDPMIQACMAKHGARYPVLRGDSETQMAWIGKPKAWAVFFVSADGKMFKKIIQSINNGIEEPVFRKYAEYLLAQRPTNQKPSP